MATRAVWKGSVGWNLVNIPARVVGAVEDREIHLSNLHKTCGGKLTQPRYCPNCEKFVEAEEVVKGFDVGESYIVITEEELASLPVRTAKRVEIEGFIRTGAFTDARHFEKPYYLMPDKGGEKAYALLREAMERERVIAFCRWTYRQREHLALLYPCQGGFILHTLRRADEVRPLEAPAQVALGEKEMGMAQVLVRGMTCETLALEAFEDEYRNTLHRLVEAKVSGVALPPPKEEAQPSGELADQLLASLREMGIKV